MSLRLKLIIRRHWIRGIIFLTGIYLNITLMPTITSFVATFNEILGAYIKIAGITIFQNLLLFFLFEIPIYSLLLSALFVIIFNKIYRDLIMKSSSLKILKAEYGAENKYVDITNILNDAIENNKLKIILSNNIAGDPVPGTVKEGKIKYRFKNKVYDKKINENQTIELPNF